MSKSGIEFKVRRWSHTSDRQYDVIALDHDNNNQHFQLDCTFSTQEGAGKHADSLTKQLTENTSFCTKFIRDHWPIDGVIE